MIELISAFLVAATLASLGEWITHKYILHGLGKKKDSWFHYHWTHHNRARRHSNFDIQYEDNIATSTDIKKEILAVAGVMVIMLPIAFFWLSCYLFMLGFAFLYYFLHKKSHLDVQWGKRWMPWHYDHHMGINQDSNWCVTNPMWDYILRTRNKYDYDENGKVLGYR